VVVEVEDSADDERAARGGDGRVVLVVEDSADDERAARGGDGRVLTLLIGG
jgi:hypothetical protein